MAERGRKSTASLSVIAGSIDGRPKTPGDLTTGQKDIWERTVQSEAADMFKTAATQQLLKEYCRHAETASRLSRQIDTATEEGEEVDLGALDRLMKMRDRETKAMGDKATKLRITNQSRYTAKTSGTAAKHAQTDLKPWQMAG